MVFVCLYCNSSLSTTHHFQMWTKSTKSDSSIRKLKVIGSFQTKRFEAEMRFDIGGDVLDLPIIATITIPQSSVFDIFRFSLEREGLPLLSPASGLKTWLKFIFFIKECVAGVLVLLVGAETMALQASVDPCNPGFVRNSNLLALLPRPSLSPSSALLSLPSIHLSSSSCLRKQTFPLLSRSIALQLTLVCQRSASTR